MVIIACFFIEDILTNWSFFFQPSGSSKSASTDSRTKRGQGKKLKEGVKYNIDSIKASGEPLTPKNIANKFVRQCGVLVKDQLPISIQEWKEPKTKRPDVTWVDDMWHSKIFIWFSAKTLWFLKRGHLNFFQKTFLLKTSFSLARFLFLFKLWCLIFWNFFSVGSLSNLFWEFNLFLLKRNSMKFGIFISWNHHDLAFLPMW